jgi:hypothetical protein
VLNRRKPNLERKKIEHATMREHFLDKSVQKASEESKYSTEASGATPGGCACVHPLEKATTL